MFDLADGMPTGNSNLPAAGGIGAPYPPGAVGGRGSRRRGRQPHPPGGGEGGARIVEAVGSGADRERVADRNGTGGGRERDEGVAPAESTGCGNVVVGHGRMECDLRISDGR